MEYAAGGNVLNLDTATDRVKAAVAALLESYRAELDRDGDLRTIHIRVRVDRDDGSVREITISRESEFSSGR